MDAARLGSVARGRRVRLDQPHRAGQMKRLRLRIESLAPRTRMRRRSRVLSWIGRRAPAAARAHVHRSDDAGGSDARMGAKIVLAGAGVAAGLLSGHGIRGFASAGILAAGGWRWPELRAARRERAKRRAVRAAVPDTLDLLAA